MKKKNNKILIFSLLIIIGITITLFAIFSSKPVQEATVGTNEQIKFAIPVQGSYICNVIQDKVGLTYDLSGQRIIDKYNVGFYTNKITNIQVEVQQGLWTSLINNKRIRYKTCNYKNVCNTEQNIIYYTWGKKYLPITSVYLQNEYLVLNYEKENLFGQWSSDDKGAKISYDSQAFGLRTVSSTFDPAGHILCTTSCDITCPIQGEREKMVVTQGNIIDFYLTAPYFEYWNTIDYDLNMQGGATVYNPSTQMFCFAGLTYTSTKTTMANGITYIYPNTATRKQEQCCPGAVISTSTEDKLCQSDYTWKTITKDDKIKCISDFNCPSQGQYTCKNKVRSGYRCGSDNYCTKDTVNTQVECCNNNDCDADQSCQNYKCVGGSTDGGGGDGDGEDKDCNGILLSHTTRPSWWDELISFGKAEPKTDSTCIETNLILTWTGIILVFILLIIAMFKFGSKKKKRIRV